jgi:hypothetical protein
MEVKLHLFLASAIGLRLEGMELHEPDALPSRKECTYRINN